MLAFICTCFERKSEVFLYKFYYVVIIYLRFRMHQNAFISLAPPRPVGSLQRSPIPLIWIR